MLEIYRKGFPFDLDQDQIVTFKKSQNLNGIQDRYSYSNTIPMDLTANNKKLLDLYYLPTNKVTTLMNGFEVDAVFNNIRLKDQILKIQKEGKEKVETFLLFSDNQLLIKLKTVYLNETFKDFRYNKTVAAFTAAQSGGTITAPFVETQESTGFYVVEEMPILLNVQEALKKIFVDNGYTVFGEFFLQTDTIKDYFIAPNVGVYQIYSGSGEGFSPVFDENLTGFDLINAILKYFNCYAAVDDTYKTVVVNKWTSLNNFKDNFIDYSAYFINYKDYVFQSKLAKKNNLNYSDSGSLFNSFFTNNLSSQSEATYLDTSFGAGSTLLFADSDLLENGNIELRANGEIGEKSAIRIYKVSAGTITAPIFENGVAQSATGKRAVSVSMRDVYDSFHKDYTDFILTPLIVNIQFRYDDILAETFSMTKVFLITQLSSYWIPLEINFTSDKDFINVRAMLVKKRKVETPILNNFNSIILDFKEKALFPLSLLNGMYPKPPNTYNWDEIIFRSYDQNLNSLFVNDVLVPAASLPQAFTLSAVSSVKIEANKPSDTQPDSNTAELIIQATDTNGGRSNDAYINIKHTGIAQLESNFLQNAAFNYSRNTFDGGFLFVNLLGYVTGLKPNLNNTITSVVPVSTILGTNDDFNLVVASESYSNVKIDISAFNVILTTSNNGIGKARAKVQLILSKNGVLFFLKEVSVANNGTVNVNVPAISVALQSIVAGDKIKVYMFYTFDNVRGLNSGSMNVATTITGMAVNITTIKTV